MIRLRGLTLSRGGRTLLSDVDASIAPGERIALIGRNGCGKSTLLAALAGDLSPDRGDIDMPPMRVAELAQHAPRSTLPAIDHVLEADVAYADAKRALDAAEAAHDAAAMADAHARMADADGYAAPSRAARLLDGLGFAPGEIRNPVDAFSGGWKMRLNLARVLMTPADLLLLDEPTNHLDLDAIVWLQDWLIRFPGTVITVSHDREFVDAIAHATLHLSGGTLRRWAGGYTAWETLSAAEADRQAKLAEAQQRQVAHLQSFIDRFKAKATKAKQAQSRVKALERMTRIAALPRERDVEFRFDSIGEGPDPLLRAEGLAAGYTDGVDTRTVLRGATVELRRGARVGVLGRNGAGKSTLIRTLVGDLPPLGGELRPARDLRVGYFAQQAIEHLRDDETPMWHLARVLPDRKPQDLRDFLAGFGFVGEQAVSPTGPFSGGEKSRLALALIAARRPHLLVLDEPTNHLDADARDALALALADFDGALLLVSHDRHLLRATVDRFVIVHDGSVEDFEGDLDDYRQWLGERAAASGVRTAPSTEAVSTDPASARDAQPSAAQRKEARAQAAETRRLLAERRRPVAKRLAAVEREMEALQARLAAIDARLADPSLYATAPADAAGLTREHGELRNRLDAVEEDWLALQGELDAIDAEG